MPNNLHVCSLDKFIPPFLTFVRKEFSIKENQFYMLGDAEKYPYEPDSQTVQHRSLMGYWLLLKLMYSADKIILHGLFNPLVLVILACNPYLLKKCYWVIWGGDLYSFMFPKDTLKYQVEEKIRRLVIKRIGYLLTYVKGDVELARQNYQAGGKHIETIGYLSNIVSNGISMKKNSKNNINILVGNSADPTNNHFEVLDKLAQFSDKNIKIYAPLSYGNKDYAKKVIYYGNSLFGDKFIGMTKFMSYTKYISFLNDIDIAIFNHHRQQAMGNTINLLAMGKKVYIKTGTSQKEFFDMLGVETFNLDEFNISINFSGKKNSEILIKYFSIQNLRSQWAKIL